MMNLEQIITSTKTMGVWLLTQSVDDVGHVHSTLSITMALLMPLPFRHFVFGKAESGE